KRQGHVSAAPIIAATAPFLCPRAVGLRGLAVVEKEARVPLKRVQHGPMRKYPRGADEIARPIAATFDLTRVEQDEILARFRFRMVAVGGVEISGMARRVFQRMITQVPLNAAQIGFPIAGQFDARRAEKWHRKIAGQMNGPTRSAAGGV